MLVDRVRNGKEVFIFGGKCNCCFTLGSDQWQQRTATATSEAQQQSVSWDSIGNSDLQQQQVSQQQQWPQQGNWQQTSQDQPSQQQQQSWQQQQVITMSYTCNYMKRNYFPVVSVMCFVSKNISKGDWLVVTS